MNASIMKLARLNCIIGGGFVMTLALFHIMQSLINVKFENPSPITPVDYSAIFIPEIEIVVRREHALPPPPVTPDPVPQINVDNNTATQGISPPTSRDWANIAQPDYGPNQYALTDGNAVAIVQVSPVYPTSALNRGLEGYVVMEFDIDEQGSVVSPRILFSEPQGIFDNAALKAILRWRYQPKVVEGNPVKLTGIQQKMSFNLDN